jgi:EmrB/QacA subfamily drug resistance transporter
MTLTRAWKVVLVTSAAVYLVALDVTIVNIAFPDLAGSFPDTSPSTLAWVLSGYSIAFASSLLVAGRLADLYGRRRLFFAGLAVFSAASAACGVAPTPALLIAGRVVQAVGGALLLPASLALLLPEFPVTRRSAAIGIWGAVGGIAAATGPSLGSVLVDAASWRAVFFVNVPVTLLAWLTGRRVLVESFERGAGRMPDVVGAVMGTTAVASLTLGIIQGDDWGYTDGRVLGAFAAALILGPALVVRSARRPAPILDIDLFRRRFFTVANSANFLFSMGFFAMLFVNINFLTRVWGYSVLAAGLAFTPGPLAAAAFAIPAGRLADRFGHARVFVPGSVLFSAGVAAYALALGVESNYWGLYFPLSLMIGSGVGLTIAPISAAANAFLPSDRFATGSAFHTTVRQVGAALGIAIVVAILGDAVGAAGLQARGPEAAMRVFDRAWAFIAISALASGITMGALYRRPATLEPAPVPQAVSPRSS